MGGLLPFQLSQGLDSKGMTEVGWGEQHLTTHTRETSAR